MSENQSDSPTPPGAEWQHRRLNELMADKPATVDHKGNEIAARAGQPEDVAKANLNAEVIGHLGAMAALRNRARLYKLEEQLRSTEAERDLNRERATTDALTGLYNRRYLDDELPGFLASSKRAGTSFSLLFIDMDRFKPINDNLGHKVGDEVIINFANQLRTVFSRLSDRIMRVGGDEFVVLLPNTPLEKSTETGEKSGGALNLANELLAHLSEEQNSFLERSGLDALPSCSIGVIQHKEQEAQVLLQEADAAMYEAKRSGKGKAVVWNESMQNNPKRQVPILSNSQSPNSPT